MLPPLTSTQVEVCRAMGIEPEDYARQLETDQAEVATALKAQNRLSNEQMAVCRAMSIDPKDYPLSHSEGDHAIEVTACRMSHNQDVEESVTALINRYTVKRHH